MNQWHTAKCAGCGATWAWFGLPGEGAFLKRCFEKFHAAHRKAAA